MSEKDVMRFIEQIRDALMPVFEQRSAEFHAKSPRSAGHAAAEHEYAGWLHAFNEVKGTVFSLERGSDRSNFRDRVIADVMAKRTIVASYFKDETEIKGEGAKEKAKGIARGYAEAIRIIEEIPEA